jgi:SAM-dependent methyltransferase
VPSAADAPPVLWLRAAAVRPILRRHLDRLAGRFRAAGWRVVAGGDPDDLHGPVVAVLDDPWSDPRPATAVALAGAPAAAAAWRVPRVAGAGGSQAWSVETGPFTELAEERRCAREAARRHVATAASVEWCGFAAAPGDEALALLAAGWPPPPAQRALVSTLACYRYSDPADHERRELDAFLPVVPGVWVEFGCGAGAFAARHRDRGRRWIGVEPDHEMAARARARLDLVLATGAGEALEALGDGLAGAVFADVLEHLSDPGDVLARLRDHLAPGARVLAAIPNAAWMPVLAALAAGRWDPTLAGVQASDHRTVFTPRSFARLAEACGYALERLAPLPAPRLGWRLRAAARLAATLAGGRAAELAAPQWVAVLAPRRAAERRPCA